MITRVFVTRYKCLSIHVWNSNKCRFPFTVNRIGKQAFHSNSALLSNSMSLVRYCYSIEFICWLSVRKYFEIIVEYSIYFEFNSTLISFFEDDVQFKEKRHVGQYCAYVGRLKQRTWLSFFLMAISSCFLFHAK